MGEEISSDGGAKATPGESRTPAGAAVALLSRLDGLERRVATLEAKLFHRSQLSSAIRTVIDKWPGPFTTQQVQDALREFFPEALPNFKHYQVEQTIRRLARSGFIICFERGYGSKANIFVKSANPPEGAGEPGHARTGTKHPYESGFRTLIRSILDDLPEKFSLADVRELVCKKAPEVRIPYGSWTSQLYKLCQRGELQVVREHHSVKHKLYARGKRRVLPSGDEAKELETAWSAFRQQMTKSQGAANALFYAAQLLDWIARPGDHDTLPALREAQKLLGYQKPAPNRWLKQRIHKAPPAPVEPALQLWPNHKSP